MDAALALISAKGREDALSHACPSADEGPSSAAA